MKKIVNYVKNLWSALRMKWFAKKLEKVYGPIYRSGSLHKNKPMLFEFSRKPLNKR